MTMLDDRRVSFPKELCMDREPQTAGGSATTHCLSRPALRPLGFLLGERALQGCSSELVLLEPPLYGHDPLPGLGEVTELGKVFRSEAEEAIERGVVGDAAEDCP
jgi:hypothetical protein